MAAEPLGQVTTSRAFDEHGREYRRIQPLANECLEVRNLLLWLDGDLAPRSVAKREAFLLGRLFRGGVRWKK